MKKIFISGSVFSGKQTLLYLLEGNKNIFSNFIHDKLIDSMISLQTKCIDDLDKKISFIDKKNCKDIFVHSIKKKKKYQLSIYQFREIINNSNIRHTERYAFLKLMPNTYSVNNDFLEFNFNFSKFEEGWKQDIFNSAKELSIENIFDILTINFLKSWDDINTLFDVNKTQDYIYASKLPNHPEAVKLVLEENFDAKIIFVERDLIGLLKSRSLHQIRERFDKIDNLDKYFYYNLKSGFLDKLKNERVIFKNLMKKYPEKLLVTSLENLIFDTEKEMNKILNFIGITAANFSYKATYCGKDLTDKHQKIINDDQYQISNNNNVFAKLRIFGIGYVKKISFVVFLKSIKIIIFSIYLNLKYKLKFKI